MNDRANDSAAIHRPSTRSSSQLSIHQSPGHGLHVDRDQHVRARAPGRSDDSSERPGGPSPSSGRGASGRPAGRGARPRRATAPRTGPFVAFTEPSGAVRVTADRTVTIRGTTRYDVARSAALRLSVRAREEVGDPQLSGREPVRPSTCSHDLQMARHALEPADAPCLAQDVEAVLRRWRQLTARRSPRPCVTVSSIAARECGNGFPFRTTRSRSIRSPHGTR